MITETSNDTISIQGQANLWITRLDNGLSSVEKQQLIAWINQDEAHYAALKKVSSVWQDITTQHELSGLFAQKVEKKPYNDYLMKGFLAASLVAVVLLSANIFNDVNYIWLNPQHNTALKPAYEKYSSQFGEQKQITLADGSVIDLNTNTVIEVAYSNHQRKVTLIRGEAKFDVVKDLTRPFTVISGHNSFTALGTIFNVERENINSVALLVKEGSVLVAQANAPVSKLLETIKAVKKQQLIKIEKSEYILSSGEKIAITNDIKSPIQGLSAHEVEQELAWQQGILIFDGEPLAQVLKEVQRYNPIKFMPINADLANLRVSGYFKTNDINGLLQSLKYNFAIHAQEVTSNTYALSSTSQET